MGLGSFSERQISIVTSCDEGYLPYIAVLAASLAASQAQSTEVELTILHDSVQAASQRQLEISAGRLPVRWIRIDTSAYDAIGLGHEPMVRRPHYFRCLIGSLLPGSTRRCLYLDGDTLVRRDLSELWRTDLDGQVVGAALDYFLPRCADAIAPWREIGLDPDARYFNSGVLLVDLDAWRANDVGERVLETCVRYRDYLLAQGRWPQHDQFGLNAVLQGSWHPLAQEWNYLSEMEPSEPGVVHYCGGGKPGSPTCRTSFTEWFYQTLDATAWRGWHPVLPSS